MGCCQRYGYFVPLFFGLIFFFGSIGFDFLISMGISQELSKRLVLTEETEFYQNWLAPKVPMHATYHLFHVKNADDFLKGKADADLEQVGPFTFGKKLKRTIYGFPENGTEITFRTSVHYTYLPELSNETAIDQNITILNLPMAAMLGAAVRTAGKSFAGMILRNALSNTIKKMDQKLLITLTPRQFLVEGYDIPIIAAVKGLGGETSEDDDPNGRFSLMSNRNGSNRGLWTSYTGKDSMSKTGVIKSWNDLTEFSCWSGKTCNEVKGVEGAFFPPPITPDTVLTIFSPELNGSMTGYFREEVHIGGLLKYRFKLMEDALEAPNNNPENECKCVKTVKAEKDKYCSLDGIQDISGCKRGAPVVLSKPHFFLGSPSLRDKFVGLNPERGLHESFFDVDPHLGVVTRALVRMQTNVDLTLLKNLQIYRKVPEVIFPCFMSEDSVKVEGEFLEPILEFQGIKYKINLTLKIVMILGAAFISIAILIWFKTRRSRLVFHKKSKAAKLSAEDEAVRASFLPLEKVEMNGNGFCKTVHGADLVPNGTVHLNGHTGNNNLSGQ